MVCWETMFWLIVRAAHNWYAATHAWQKSGMCNIVFAYQRTQRPLVIFAMCTYLLGASLLIVAVQLFLLLYDLSELLFV